MNDNLPVVVITPGHQPSVSVNMELFLIYLSNPMFLVIIYSQPIVPESDLCTDIVNESGFRYHTVHPV